MDFIYRIPLSIFFIPLAQCQKKDIPNYLLPPKNDFIVEYILPPLQIILQKR